MDYQWLQNRFTAVTSFIKDHIDYNNIYSDWNSAGIVFHNDIYMTMMLYRSHISSKTFAKYRYMSLKFRFHSSTQYSAKTVKSLSVVRHFSR